MITGTGSFTATSTKGNIAFQSLGGALRINQVSTTGKIWLFGDEDIVGVDPSKVHVSGSSIEISAPRGGIGSFNADGSVNVRLPSSIGELRFDNIRVAGAPQGQSMGSISLHDIDLSQASLKISLHQ